MELVTWSDALYSVKIKEMDSHHKKIVELINKLHDAMMNGNGKNVLLPIFNDLKSYAKYHFEAEEKLMKQYNYPHLSTQEREHKMFIDKISELYEKFSSGSKEMSIETLKFLKNWLYDHILKEDKQYSHFFNDKGVV